MLVSLFWLQIDDQSYRAAIRARRVRRLTSMFGRGAEV